jgi:hypothetical protein
MCRVCAATGVDESSSLTLVDLVVWVVILLVPVLIAFGLSRLSRRRGIGTSRPRSPFRLPPAYLNQWPVEKTEFQAEPLAIPAARKSRKRVR